MIYLCILGSGQDIFVLITSKDWHIIHKTNVNNVLFVFQLIFIAFYLFLVSTDN